MRAYKPKSVDCNLFYLQHKKDLRKKVLKDLESIGASVIIELNLCTYSFLQERKLSLRKLLFTMFIKSCLDLSDCLARDKITKVPRKIDAKLIPAVHSHTWHNKAWLTREIARSWIALQIRFHLWWYLHIQWNIVSRFLRITLAS